MRPEDGYFPSFEQLAIAADVICVMMRVETCDARQAFSIEIIDDGFFISESTSAALVASRIVHT
jgi:hypothetical protein